MSLKIQRRACRQPDWLTNSQQEEHRNERWRKNDIGQHKGWPMEGD